MPQALMPTFGERTIDDLQLMFCHRQINLDPGFQRKSVWSWNDRRRLVQSILSGYPYVHEDGSIQAPGFRREGRYRQRIGLV